MAAPCRASPVDADWAIEETGVQAGGPLALELDSAGAVHVAFFERNGADVRYATNATGSWERAVTVGGYDHGWGQYLGVDVGPSDHPIFVWAHNGPDGRELRYSYAQGEDFVQRTAASCGYCDLRDVAVAVDAAGAPHFAYFETDNAGGGTVQYLRPTSTDCPPES